MNPIFKDLLASSRVSMGTRAALAARAVADVPQPAPAALSAELLQTLRAVLDRVIPQRNPAPIDLAARIDQQLALGVGDGWRFANLPADAVAYAHALSTLNHAAAALAGVEFSLLEHGVQDDLLARMQCGDLHVDSYVDLRDGPASARLTAPQLQSWFEDVRADAVRVFVAHPQTLAWMGYSGFANGGDGEPKSGFTRVGLDEREIWEPVASSREAP